MKQLIFIYLFISCLHISAQTDLYLFVGQSNMAGRAPIEADTLPIEQVLILNSKGVFQKASNPLNQFSTIRKDNYAMQRIGPAYGFSTTVTDYLQDTIRIIVQARGGTSIEKFMKGSDWGYYESVVNRTKNALEKYPDSRLRAVLWHQGESNSSKPDDYIKKFHQLIVDLRSDLDHPDLPVFFGELGQWRDHYAAMRDKMRQIPDSIPYTYLVSSKDLTNQDDAHFDKPSQLLFGKRYAEKCIEVLYE